MKPIRVVQYGSWGYTHSEHTMLTMRSLPAYYEVVGGCVNHPNHKKATPPPHTPPDPPTT